MEKIKSNPELAKIDFSNSKPVSEVPALAKHQAERRAQQNQTVPRPSGK